LETWALRGLQRWPNVPALFGWLGLDRRGRWLIRGETISRPQIIETIDRNYEADAHGRWFFQNGPQRGYVNLETAPLIARVEADHLITHTQLAIERPESIYLDEEGSLLIATEHGPAALDAQDLDWALQRLRVDGIPVEEQQLFSCLSLPSGASTELEMVLGDRTITVMRLDRDVAPDALGFIRTPRPLEGERSDVRESD
jgi:Protein of unknown function (DUF2946)